MASKALLFAAVALAAFAYATATDCYVCNSIITPDCEKPQGKDSNTFDCASQTPLTGLEYVCGKVIYEIADFPRVERTCFEKSSTCEALKEQYSVQGAVLKECNLCGDKLCNGQ